MRNWKLLLRPLVVASALVLVLFAARWAVADELGGKIRGTVSDPSGALIPGAKVKATNVATGISKEVEAGAEGGYEFLQLDAPADYKVTATQTGFKTFQATDIHLSLNQIYVLNITLELGQITQEVTVHAAAAQVETTSMQLGRTLSSNMIVDLPLNGRDWITLQQTLPGVVASDRFPDNFATNGSRSQANDYLVNGTDANDLAINTPLQTPSPDAIAEVSLITNTINPEYGRNGGAILNAETKSGTNQLHGDAFDFYRDTGLNTRNFFSKERTIFHQHQFGGVIGGPIKKDKAFFFFSYQGTRRREPEPASSCGGCDPGTYTVLTGAERTGDFSADTGGAFPSPNPAFGFLGASPLPLTGEDGNMHPAGTPYATLFPTGHIPAADLNTVAVGLTNTYVPLPTTSGNLFEFNPVEASTFNQYLGRIDFNRTAKDSIFGYWFIEPRRTTDDLPFFGADLPGFTEFSREHIYQYTLAWNRTISPTMVNEVRLGYNRFNFDASEPLKPIVPSSVGFTGINPQNPKVAGVPVISLSGGGLFSLGSSAFGPQPRIDQTYHVTENLSKVVGNHTLKFGFQTRRSAVSNQFYARNGGVFNFNGAGTFSTGLAGADFLLGVPDLYIQGSGNFIDARTQTYYAYAQDQWKVTRNLTLTYGTGWEVDTPLKDLNNGGLSVNCFRPGQQSKVFPTAPAGLTFPGDPGCNSSNGVTTQFTHFAPRFGFAWSPSASKKWSIRGGYGIYYNRAEEELLLQSLIAPPFALNSTGIGDAGGSPSFATPFSGFQANFDVNGNFTGVSSLAIANKFPFFPPKAGSAVDFTFFEPFPLNVQDPNLSVPYSENYNLTLERELPSDMILSLSYVGLVGHKLTNAIELNPGGSEAGNPICLATPGCSSFTNFFLAPQTFRYPQVNPNGFLIFGSVGQQGTFVNSNYNAFQATLDKKLSHGLLVRATYAWAHSLDGASSFEDLGFSGVRGLDPFNPRANYGDSAFDARQRFVFTYLYDIPSVRRFGAFRGIPRPLTDGWRVTGIYTLQTGIPVTVGDSSVGSGTCDLFFEFYSCWDRPDRLSTSIRTVDPRTSSFKNSLGGTAPALGPQDHYWFDPNSFGVAAPGALGNAGRNFFHGPGINNFTFGFYKDTRITESTKLELRFEFFNLFNHAQFSINGVRSDANSANFGRVLSARNPSDSRVVQLAAKFYF